MAVNIKCNPLPGELVRTSKFGPRWGRQHRGVDYQAVQGTPIIAVDDGTVNMVRWDAEGYGHYIVLKHNGYYTLYAHMMHKTQLSEGTQVSAGTIIGYSGNTGGSTGPHLHFEIRIGEGEFFSGTNAVDPEPYLSGVTSVDGTPVTPGIGSSGSTPRGGYMVTSEEVVDLVAVARRVSDVASHPLHAYLNIYVGEPPNLELLATLPPKPSTLQEFTFNRLEKAGNSAMLILFDDNWDELETKLSAHAQSKIHIQYGYVGMEHMKSKLYTLILGQYSIALNPTGTVLSIEAKSEDVIENMKPISMKIGTFNPTEAVKRIARKMNWKVKEENFDPSSDIPHIDDPFNLVEEYPIQYIKTKIVPAASKPGEELFTFYLDEDNYAHFKREYYKQQTSHDEIKTYVYQKGYDSPVVSFNFTNKWTFSGTGPLKIVSGARVSVFDPINKTTTTAKEDSQSTVTGATGNFRHLKSNQSVPVLDAAGDSPVQMKSKLYYHIKHAIDDVYDATMTIIGDPTIEIFSQIRLIVITDKGYYHHASGIYMIKGITDTISGGQYLTSLQLKKNSMIENGLELINPKYVVK